jgi:beta-ribofuranosylaminobenzene 5'-phosphate synthase
MARVTAGARLHFGFRNLSLAREPLYGGVGVALTTPRVVVEAHPAGEPRCEDPLAAVHARRAVELLDVSGAAVELRETLPRHAGLGSGTQLALAVLAAVARAHDRAPRVRERAPALGRGGRSGVGVAAFETGGFVLDAGQPTERFTASRPADGDWDVPAIAARRALPASWRFVLALPDVPAGRSDDAEDESMRAVVKRADPRLADEIGRLVAERLLPAAETDDWAAFGAAIAELSRLNGAWYADAQGGVYRPPLGTVIDELGGSPAVAGAGQSSWGPAVYGLTTVNRAGEARAAAREALAAAGVDGDVCLAAPRNEGAWIESG